jgi:hypothetical protein
MCYSKKVIFSTFNNTQNPPVHYVCTGVKSYKWRMNGMVYALMQVILLIISLFITKLTLHTCIQDDQKQTQICYTKSLPLTQPPHLYQSTLTMVLTPCTMQHVIWINKYAKQFIRHWTIKYNAKLTVQQQQLFFYCIKHAKHQFMPCKPIKICSKKQTQTMWSCTFKNTRCKKLSKNFLNKKKKEKKMRPIQHNTD